MDTVNFKECIGNLKVLKRDAQKMQKKGLPFMMSADSDVGFWQESGEYADALCNGIRSASAPVWLNINRE